ncbi:MAG: MBL fold metallo-hydrolase [Gammaproteobacteria bacterium]|nr:MBL fold metallo-hydrolase [Gammaproteobacteria bacterium]MCP5198879.1 MBL fold metallo-hydrolase [Gammaproteobacteria bacterium]
MRSPAAAWRGLAWLALLLAASAALAQSRGWSFAENDNAVMAAQSGGGQAAAAGPVRVEFYGHMAFRITTPRGLGILIDPWRNDPSGAWGLWFPAEFPEIAVDLVLSTHAHFDHDAVHRPHATSVLERLAGRLELGDAVITGLADKHVCEAPGWYAWDASGPEFGQHFCPPDNPLHMDNFIQVVTTGGLRIAHWGDNRAQPAPYADAALAGVDVLILPIDASHHLLSDDDVAAIIARYRPRLVIPAHYHMPGTSSVLTTLGPAAEWVGRQPRVRRLDGASVELNAADLPAREAWEVLYFGDHAARD